MGAFQTSGWRQSDLLFNLFFVSMRFPFAFLAAILMLRALVLAVLDSGIALGIRKSGGAKS